MKLDPSSTFLNGTEDVTAALAPQARPVRWGRRAVIAVIVLLIVGYLALIASSLREQFRPEVSPLADGWFRITDRDLRFQFELPIAPKKLPLGPKREYHAFGVNGLNFTVSTQSHSVARELLNKTATKVLQEAAQVYAIQGKVTVLGMGVLGTKTHWLESKVEVSVGSERYAIRRRLMIHDKQLLELTVEGPEGEVMAADATRIMNSAQWLSR